MLVVKFINTHTLTLSSIGLLVGTLISGCAASFFVNHSNTSMVGLFSMHGANQSPDSMDMTEHKATDSSVSMSFIVSSLNNKTGDAFKMLFLAEMITHHQGAINMAKLAAIQAKHQEVKDLANDVVAAQTSETSKMQQWQNIGPTNLRPFQRYQ